MATLALTFTFLATAQNFTAAAGTSVTSMIWDSAVGNPLGSLTQTRTLKAASVGTSTWTQTITYEGLGVPPGATITGITSGSLQSKFTTYTSADTTTGSTSGAVTLADGTNTVTLSVQRLFKGNPSGTSAPDSAFTTTNGTNATVGGGTFTAVASSTSCTITINNGLRNTNITGSSVVLKQDQLAFTINYTPGAWNYKAGGSGTGIDQGLLGHWPLDEMIGTPTTGTIVRDISGYNNNGTLTSTFPTYVADPRFGKVIQQTSTSGGTLSFGNIWDSYFANQSFTVCFWNKMTTTYTQFNALIGKINGSSPFNGWEIFSNEATANGSFKILDGGQNVAEVDWTTGNGAPASTETLNVWHFICAYMDRGTQQIGYSVDGFPFLTASCSTVGSLTNTASVLAFNGQAGSIHDLRIYSRPLTLSEVNQIISRSNPVVAINPLTLLRNANMGPPPKQRSTIVINRRIIF